MCPALTLKPVFISEKALSTKIAVMQGDKRLTVFMKAVM